jgi:hypothetical protein
MNASSISLACGAWPGAAFLCTSGVSLTLMRGARTSVVTRACPPPPPCLVDKRVQENGTGCKTPPFLSPILRKPPHTSPERTPLGPYRRPMHRVLGGSYGGTLAATRACPASLTLDTCEQCSVQRSASGVEVEC